MEESALRKLLTDETILQILRAVMQDAGMGIQSESARPGQIYVMSSSQAYLMVEDDRVRVRGGYDYEANDRLAESTRAAIKTLGLAALKQQVFASMTNIAGAYPEVEEQTAEQGGKYFPATVLTVQW